MLWHPHLEDGFAPSEDVKHEALLNTAFDPARDNTVILCDKVGLGGIQKLTHLGCEMAQLIPRPPKPPATKSPSINAHKRALTAEVEALSIS